MNTIEELIKKHLPNYRVRDVTLCDSKQLKVIAFVLRETMNDGDVKDIVFAKRTKKNKQFFLDIENRLNQTNTENKSVHVNIIFMYDAELKAFETDGNIEDGIEGIVRCLTNSVLDNGDVCVICNDRFREMVNCTLCGAKICNNCVANMPRMRVNQHIKCPVCKTYDIA
jgi:hypothetical protein